MLLIGMLLTQRHSSSDAACHVAAVCTQRHSKSIQSSDRMGSKELNLAYGNPSSCISHFAKFQSECCIWILPSGA